MSLRFGGPGSSSASTARQTASQIDSEVYRRLGRLVVCCRRSLGEASYEGVDDDLVSSIVCFYVARARQCGGVFPKLLWGDHYLTEGRCQGARGLSLRLSGATELIDWSFVQAKEAVFRLVEANIHAFTDLERQLASRESGTRTSKPSRRIPARPTR